MAAEVVRVLVIAKTEQDMRSVEDVLCRSNTDATFALASSTEEIRQHIAGSQDIILAMQMNDYAGAEMVLNLRPAFQPDIPLIVITVPGDELNAPAWMAAGARDVLTFHQLPRLPAVVQRELQVSRSREACAEALAALQESELRYRQMVETAGEGIWVLDNEMRTTYVNQQMADLLGYERDEMLGHHLYEFIDPSDLPEARSFIERHTEDKVHHGEARFLRQDGQSVWGAISATPLYDYTGKLVGSLCMLTDITDRKMAQNSLRRERAFLDSAIALLPFPIIFNTPDGSVLRANEASYRFFGGMDTARWWETPLLRMDTRAVVPKSEWPMMRSARGEVVPAMEGILVLPDGREVPVLAFSAPIYIEEQLVATVAAFQDITAIKEADRAKDEFLAVLSHELRTPLTSIIGWTKQARTHPGIIAKALDTIERNAKRQKQLLEDLIDLSMILTGRLHLKPEQADLWQITRETLEDERPELKKHELQLHVHAPGASLPVQADTVRLHQAIHNLLSNAVKFAHTGDTVEVTAHPEGGVAVLSVTDTGRGIPKDQLDNIFKPFHQVDRSELTGGLGLGLALVKGIVELHGGHVHAYSAGDGKGSTFTIELPLREAA